MNNQFSFFHSARRWSIVGISLAFIGITSLHSSAAPPDAAPDEKKQKAYNTSLTNSLNLRSALKQVPIAPDPFRLENLMFATGQETEQGDVIDCLYFSAGVHQVARLYSGNSCRPAAIYPPQGLKYLVICGNEPEEEDQARAKLKTLAHKRLSSQQFEELDGELFAVDYDTFYPSDQLVEFEEHNNFFTLHARLMHTPMGGDILDLHQSRIIGLEGSALFNGINPNSADNLNLIYHQLPTINPVIHRPQAPIPSITARQTRIKWHGNLHVHKIPHREDNDLYLLEEDLKRLRFDF